MNNFLKNFKEESIALPASLICFFLINYMLAYKFPTAALFDVASQLETLYYGAPAFIITLVVTWIGIRITFPAIYKYLRRDFYEGFATLPDDSKRKYAVILFIVFLLCASISSRSVGAENSPETRAKILFNLNGQLGVREITPNNSPEIELYLKTVGVYSPASWCGAYVGYNLFIVGVSNPMSAWSPNYAKTKDIIWTPKKRLTKPLPADVFTLYYSNLRRVGHTGFYVGTDKSGYFITIEGNTNGSGSREGDGVYKKKRDPRKIHAITRYIKS